MRLLNIGLKNLYNFLLLQLCSLRSGGILELAENYKGGSAELDYYFFIEKIIA